MKIKSKYTTIVLSLLLVAVTTIFTACTKEGPQGLPGLDGEDGVDGAQTCSACHNVSEMLKAKIAQYENSVHATGANTNRSDVDCARCHTSMGFRNFIADSSMAAIVDATPINCRTCHPIHESYTIDDFVLRTTDSITLMVGDVTYDYGKSNLCVNCHQARPMTPYPDLNSKDSVTITSGYFGPHHATQANMFMAVGPVKIPGSIPYLNSAHTRMVDGGCVTCHMSPATGVLAGGHQMGVKYTDGHGSTAYQYTGCIATDCHGTTTEINGLINPNRIEIEELTEELRLKLIEKGLLNNSDRVPAPITVSQKQASAIVNYKFVEGDQSTGAHNYRFIKALLTNSIEAIDN